MGPNTAICSVVITLLLAVTAASACTGGGCKDHDLVCSSSAISTVSSTLKLLSQERIVMLMLEIVVPEVNMIYMDLLDAPKWKEVPRVEVAYNALAVYFRERAHKDGYDRFLEAVNEIAIAEAEACDCSRDTKFDARELRKLSSDYLGILTYGEHTHEARAITGKVLCLEKRRRESEHTEDSEPEVQQTSRPSCPPGGIKAVTTPAEFFACLDPGDVLKPILGLNPTELEVVAFLVDTTGSMSEEIGTAKKVVLDFVKSEENVNNVGYYVNVPFGDNGAPSNSVGPTVTADPYANTTELQQFYNGVEAMNAAGGGDEPEYSLSAIIHTFRNKKVYPKLQRGSQFVLITDASAKMPSLADSVIQEAKKYEVCIHFFISERNIHVATADGVYERIATETGGVIIKRFDHWQLASFVATIRGHACKYTTAMAESIFRTRRGSYQWPQIPHLPPPAAHVMAGGECQSFQVSMFTYLLKGVAGVNDGATVTVTQPNGVKKDYDGTYGFAVFSEGNPLYGKWTVCTSSGALVHLVINQDTSMDAVAMYTPANSTSDCPNTEEPPSCSLGRIVIVTSDSGNITAARLLINRTEELVIEKDVLLKHHCDGALVSDIIDFPRKGVYDYEIVGIDAAGIEFRFKLYFNESFEEQEDSYKLYPAGCDRKELTLDSEDEKFEYLYVFQNTNEYPSIFTFDTEPLEGFIVYVQKPSEPQLILPGESILVHVGGYATYNSEIKSGSSHALRLTASNGCASISVTEEISVTLPPTSRPPAPTPSTPTSTPTSSSSSPTSSSAPNPNGPTPLSCGCQNGGTCYEEVRRGIRNLRCMCPSGYSGYHCEYRGAAASMISRLQSLLKGSYQGMQKANNAQSKQQTYNQDQPQAYNQNDQPQAYNQQGQEEPNKPQQDQDDTFFQDLLQVFDEDKQQVRYNSQGKQQAYHQG